MYFIIREGKINAGPFGAMAEARDEPGFRSNDQIASSDSGRAMFIVASGRWVKIRHVRIMGDKLREEMQRQVLGYEKANALTRSNDVELQDAIDEAKRQQAADMVNAPPHYNQAGIECIDAIAAATSGKTGIQAVCVANVVKYLWRYELKNGVEDVKKARWYLDRLIGELEKDA
ncbi:hypothetical protein SIPHO4S_00014 [Serratia phage Tsm2]|uniref:DUF3310 domain-containing protein n=1 Tax=Serratia phage Tsm2 TaxID=2787014 RepID=A0A7S9SP00_9CAUD|nr:hypothetical protein PF629_gp14 [Serratia phage Tsm2]QPI13710.1 hypothetical protein SIPHO4S_00014 [Serratia phage Tsm2]